MLKILMILMCLGLTGCSVKKVLMKNCERVGEIIYECEEIN